jgi:hypothetical protein
MTLRDAKEILPRIPEEEWLAFPKARFPRYLTHETARINGCFQCCRSFDRTQAPIVSSYPEGKWQLICRHCGASTWYDCREEEA